MSGCEFGFCGGRMRGGGLFRVLLVLFERFFLFLSLFRIEDFEIQIYWALVISSCQSRLLLPEMDISKYLSCLSIWLSSLFF